MKTTQNLEMKIPEGADPIDIADITGNFEKLDTEIAKKANASGGDISAMAVKTLDTIAAEFPVPSAGESSKTFLGKVRKFVKDFNNFKTGILTLGRLVNNGQTTEPGFALDARYGRTLYELYAQLNADLNYYRRIRYGVKFIVDSGGKDWIRIPLADLGFPNDILTDYPCVVTLPQININDTVNTNRDVRILCSKPNADRKSIELLLNRAFSGGLLFSVWYIA